eukprot:Lankesteria_metandrocarpae@DN5003_c0_g1_i1.p2
MTWSDFSAFLAIYDDVTSGGETGGDKNSSYQDLESVLCNDISSQSSVSNSPVTSKQECYCAIVQRRYTSVACKHAFRVLNDTLRLFGPAGISVAFNGGKDAVVCAALYAAALANFYCVNKEIQRDKPTAVYFRSDTETHFPEVDEFVERFCQRMDFDLRTVNHGYVEGLQNYLTSVDNAGPRVIILGNRRSDPRSSNLGTFEPSSDWLPPFLRVHPLLRWHYGSVWDFLTWHNLPYCELYDRGFTSIGTMTNSFPNPVLRLRGDFLSAHCLREPDWNKERWGRELDPGKVGKSYVSSMVPQKCDAQSCYTKTAWRLAARGGSTAGLIIIGDEVLNGRVKDINSSLAEKMLKAIGWKVGCVIVLPDDVDVIAAEVRRQSEEYDIVITSGGVGPTHDDVTMEGVAKALRQKMIPVASLASAGAMIEGVAFNETPIDLSLAASQSAPELCDLRNPCIHKETRRVWPICQCSNIFILPGVPNLFKRKLEIIVTEFLAPNAVGYTQRVCLKSYESSFAMILSEVNNEKPKSVSIGSYPRGNDKMTDKEVRSVVIFDGNIEEDVVGVVRKFLSLLAPEVVVRVDNEVTIP